MANDTWDKVPPAITTASIRTEEETTANAMEVNTGKQLEPEPRGIGNSPSVFGIPRLPDIDVATERIALLVVGLLGMTLSAFFVISLASRRDRRSLTNAFLYHSGLLDCLKSSYPLLLAVSIRPTRLVMDRQGVAKYEVLSIEEQIAQWPHTAWMTVINAYDVTHLCTLLSTTYVVFITIYVFNILAILCTEAFAFTDDNQQALIAGNESELDDLEPGKAKSPQEVNSIQELLVLHTAKGINGCCVVFTIGMIYLASLVLHLGPTIIAGQFDMDASQDIFHCNLLGGEVRNYITFSMWLAIICLAMASAVYYSIVFYRMIISNSSYRIVNLLRAGVVLATRHDGISEQQVAIVISMYKNRARVLVALIALTVACYYPLLLIMLGSLKFTPQPFLYKICRLVSLTNPIFNALLFLTFDNQLNCAKWLSSSQSFRGRRANFFNRRQAGGRVHDKEVGKQSRPLVLQNNTALSTRERFELIDNTTVHERIGQRLRNATSSSMPEALARTVANDGAYLTVIAQNGKDDGSPIRSLPSDPLQSPQSLVIRDISPPPIGFL